MANDEYLKANPKPGYNAKNKENICTLSCNSGHYCFGEFVRDVADYQDSDLPPYFSDLLLDSISTKPFTRKNQIRSTQAGLSNSSQLRFAGAGRKRQAIDSRAPDNSWPSSSLLHLCCPLSRIDPPIRLWCRDFAHWLMVHETPSILIRFAALVADERTRLLRPVLAMRHARPMVIETSGGCVRFAAFFAGVRTGLLIP